MTPAVTIVGAFIVYAVLWVNRYRLQQIVAGVVSKREPRFSRVYEGVELLLLIVGVFIVHGLFGSMLILLGA